MKHELREIDPDPKDWFEGPREREQLIERADPWHRGPDAWIVIVLGLLSVGAIALIGVAMWIVWRMP